MQNVYQRALQEKLQSKIFLGAVSALLFSQSALAQVSSGNSDKPALSASCQEKVIAAAVAVERAQLIGSKDPLVEWAGGDLRLRSLKSGGLAVTLWLESIKDNAGLENPYYISYKVVVDSNCSLKTVTVGSGHY